MEGAKQDNDLRSILISAQHLLFDPCQVRHGTNVNARKSTLRTSETVGCNTADGPFAILLVHQRTTTIAGTRDQSKEKQQQNR